MFVVICQTNRLSDPFVFMKVQWSGLIDSSFIKLTYIDIDIFSYPREDYVTGITRQQVIVIGRTYSRMTFHGQLLDHQIETTVSSFRRQILSLEFLLLGS